MGRINLMDVAAFADEIEYDTSTGTSAFVLVATLAENPVQIILQNDSNVTVLFSTNGTSKKITFTAGTKIIMDMRANHGIAANMTFPIGLPIYVNCPAGVGIFRIAYTYAAI